jgi:hypothetical protein
MKLRAIALLPLILTVCLAPLLSAEEPKDKNDEAAWKPMFDGKTLEGWKATPFGGEGEVYVEDGKLVLDFGASMTGVTWKRPFPKSNYEIRWEAMRVEGNDFFSAVTFPVGDSYCSLINGGWGGTVVGLSSLDGLDASENQTGQFMEFVNGRWYKFRVRVTEGKIEAWIDDQQKIDEDIAGRKVNTRIEVDLNKPLGFATWDTRGALRKIEYREITK